MQIHLNWNFSRTGAFADPPGQYMPLLWQVCVMFYAGLVWARIRVARRV